VFSFRNLLIGKSPDKAVTTHPSIIKAAIQIAREAGGVPSIQGTVLQLEAWPGPLKRRLLRLRDQWMPLSNLTGLSGREVKEVFKNIEIDQAVLGG
jgi:hypothetical protein